MPPFSLPTRHLLQNLSTATLGITRSKMVPESNGFISAFRYGGRGILTRLSLKSSDIFMQKRNLHTASEGAKSEDKASQKEESRKTYTDRYGEEIMFSPRYPPSGYVFVPSGNAFLTRRCRELAPKLYAVYRPKSRKRLAAQEGLYVPKDAFEEAESDYKAKRARVEQKLWRALDKEYPKIPVADKNELHRLISSKCNGLVGNSALHLSGITTYAYVRDRYTPFKSLNLSEESRDGEAIDRVHQRVREILASWRGNDSSEKSSRKSKDR